MNEFSLDAKAIAADLAQLAQKYGLRRFDGTFRMNFDSQWQRDIQFHWAAGRHGEDAHLIKLHSELDVTMAIDAPQPIYGDPK